MYERSPDFFRKFQKRFLFFILEEEPALDTSQFSTFAYSFHEDPSEFCKKVCPHYHLLIDKQNVKECHQLSSLSSYNVPCLFTCFKVLFQDISPKVCYHGEIFDKLKEAVLYNEKMYSEKREVKPNYKRKLPGLQESTTVSVQTQTDILPSATTNRFLKLYNSEFYSEFSKIIDIMNSGYGSLNVDNKTLFVKFVFEKKFVC